VHNLALKQDEKYNYGDYITWNDSEYWELIDGIPYNMAPPNRFHQEISGELFGIFHNYLKGKSCKVYAAPFGVRLPLADEEDKYIKNAVLPDIVIVCDKKKLDDAGCRGAPDLIVEILSPSTNKMDSKEKFLLYEKTGVKEYWIIDPYHKIVSVYTLGKDNLYGRPDMYTEEDKIKVGIFSDLEIELNTVFAL